MAVDPVGRTASGGTVVRLNAEIYAHARAKGLFAGISLEGASLNQDENAIRTFYGEDASPETLRFKQQAPRGQPAADSFQKSLPQ